MSHVLPPHAMSDSEHSGLSPTFSIDPNHPDGPQLPPGPAHPTVPSSGSRKRRKAADGSGQVDDSEQSLATGGGRRLRRLHEACARCRTKKIKCDSKHPKCTACATAGVICQQEDRYRQTLTPRGHTDFLEHQLNQAVVLIRHLTRNNAFNPDHFNEALEKEGLGDSNGNLLPHLFAPSGDLNGQPPRYVNAPPMGVPPGAGPPLSHGYGPIPHGIPYQPGVFLPPMVPPPPGFTHGPHPAAYQHGIHPVASPVDPPRPQQPPSQSQPVYGLPPSSHTDERGRDPNRNDLSSEKALVNTFNLPPAVAASVPLLNEDLAVGSGTLASGRDLGLNESTQPRDKSKWISVSMRRQNTLASLMNPPEDEPEGGRTDMVIWLPRDRKTVDRIVEVYFERLNIHRPVFSREDFESRLNALYASRAISHDPGFICSLYLLLALGTMSQLAHTVGAKDHEGKRTLPEKAIPPSQAMPKEWPDYEELFERALVIKPDLRVTISSLQALILLHWYLYTERQGRSLWRLVGSMVRLSIELGLHHDPRIQKEIRDNGGEKALVNIFSEDEYNLRIRLWDIVMIHDRGTSVLLGRPLAISPHDSNTPPPNVIPMPSLPFSEHYQFSYLIADIQADIINSLYTPQKPSGSKLLQHTTRILDLIQNKCKQLPAKYQNYFGGTENWPIDERIKLVEKITGDEGLTLLKVSITRLLLMRAMFRAENGLPTRIQQAALRDAVHTAHNIIVIHNQMIRFPDAAFFVSPLPLHIAAFIILFGHEYKCTPLAADVEISDVWMALDMLPRFRWRWERKDYNGGHPVIHGLAERVLNVDLRLVGPASHPMLLCEETDWTKIGETDWASLQQHVVNPSLVSAETTAITPTPNSRTTAASPRTVKREPGISTTAGPVAPDGTPIAQQGLYPYLLDNSQTLPSEIAVVSPTHHAIADANGVQNLGKAHEEFSRAWTQHGGLGAYQQSQTAYVLEERDTAPTPHDIPQWMQAVRTSPYHSYIP